MGKAPAREEVDSDDIKQKKEIEYYGVKEKERRRFNMNYLLDEREANIK